MLLPTLRQFVPSHRFCLDLFGGGGAFILDDSHEEACYNDINGEACNFFRVCRDKIYFELLLSKLRSTPYSREEYFECDRKWESEQDPVERARRWFVVVNMGFTHQSDCHSFKTGFSRDARALRNHVEDLPEIHEKLRNITIENLDFRRALKVYDRDTPECLIFADPPYLGSKSEMYQHEFTIRDHMDLLSWLNQTRSQVILCGYDSELYHSSLLPPKWVLVKKVRVAQVGNSSYSERENRVEHIWVKKSLGGMWDALT